jgi:aryl-alcohol dehydrogenase-like predicted oxidoreductase
VRYIKLGSTGLDISPIAIGAMTYGEPDRGHPVWSLGEDDSRPLIKHALDAGINFFDTANMYSLGSSEEILGRALKDFADRDDIVIATKVRHQMRPGPNGKGLSRKAIMTEIDHSLRRLGTDYVDLYQIHRLDNGTPIEETLEALHDVVKAGKARYLGASSMHAWEFSKALHLQRQHGWARFVSMQDHYNLLAREEEREMLPLCADEGVGTIVWSPLARGRLARPWNESTTRSATDGGYANMLYTNVDSDRHRPSALSEPRFPCSRARCNSCSGAPPGWKCSRPMRTGLARYRPRLTAETSRRQWPMQPPPVEGLVKLTDVAPA